MKVNRRIAVVAATVVLVAAGGGGIAYAVGGGGEESVTGPDAQKAKSAALRAVGGGTVLEVERQDGDGAGVFEVEVRRDDGSQVEVHLDGGFRPVGTEPDDDSGSGSDDDAGEGADTDD
jgi:hypothetical protein